MAPHVPVALSGKGIAESVFVDVFRPRPIVSRRLIGPLLPACRDEEASRRADAFLEAAHGVLRDAGVPRADVGEWVSTPKQRMHELDTLTQALLRGPT